MPLDWSENPEIPEYNSEFLQDTELRQSVAKANAYYKFAKFYSTRISDPSDISMSAATVTEETHTLDISTNPQENITSAITELAYAEGLLQDNTQFRETLRNYRQQLQNIIQM